MHHGHHLSHGNNSGLGQLYHNQIHQNFGHGASNNNNNTQNVQKLVLSISAQFSKIFVNSGNFFTKIRKMCFF